MKNRKAVIVTYLPFWKYMLLIVAIVLVFFFLTNGKNLINKIDKGGSCPPGLIPERWELDPNTGYSYWANYTNNRVMEFGGNKILNKWANGQVVEYFDSCKPATKEGENANYRYCRNILYRDTPINPDGTLEKPIRIYVNLVVDTRDSIPVDNHNNAYKIVDYSCSASISY